MAGCEGSGLVCGCPIVVLAGRLSHSETLFAREQQEKRRRFVRKRKAAFWTFRLIPRPALLPYMHSPQGLARRVLPSCGGGPLGSFRTPSFATLQPSNTAAFSSGRVSLGQIRTFHGSSEHLSRRILFRD